MGKQIEISGKLVELNDEGFLLNPAHWTPELADVLSREEGIELTEKHFAVLNYLRERFLAGDVLTIRKVGNSGITDIKELYQLFPGGPLKKSSRIAGIPKPTSCV